MLIIVLNGALLACLAVHSEVHSQEARHSQSHLTICFNEYFWVLDLETCWVAVACHQEGGGCWCMAGGQWLVACSRLCIVVEIIILVESIDWIECLVQWLQLDLTMAYRHAVDNGGHRFCRAGRQWNLGESRSSTQIFKWDLQCTSHWFWPYVCTFCLGMMAMMAMVTMWQVMMAMVILAMVMVSVMVTIVPEVLRQVGWISQH